MNRKEMLASYSRDELLHELQRRELYGVHLTNNVNAHYAIEDDGICVRMEIRNSQMWHNRDLMELIDHLFKVVEHRQELGQY